MNFLRSLLLIGFLKLLTAFTCFSQQTILLNAHAHNDYKHEKPLLDALDNGFFSIEVDVFYENGLFIVAHTCAGIRKKNTLEKLYLLPLKQRVAANNGKVYSNGPLEFEMMIDLKSGWSKEQLDSLNRYVQHYAELFTVFEDSIKTPRAVRIVLSGGGSKYAAAEHHPRYFSIDGNLNDFDSLLDSNFICRISSSYGSAFRWRGRGAMPKLERENLHDYVSKAHAVDRKIRFWAATNKKSVWKELLDAGVDWINVDNLTKFRAFSQYVRDRNP